MTSEPRADVQRPDGTYEKYANWPVPGARDATLHLGATNATQPGTLGTRPQTSGPRPRQSFLDRGRELNTDAELLPAPDVANPNRLAYLSPPLTSPTICPAPRQCPCGRPWTTATRPT